MGWIRHPGRDLDAYLDGELDAGAARRVAEHLDACPRCQRRVSTTVRIHQSLRTMARRLFG